LWISESETVKEIGRLKQVSKYKKDDVVLRKKTKRKEEEK